jgi:fructokinase
LALPDIHIVSDEDLSWMVPEHVSLKDTVDDALRSGPSVVFPTRGGEGATGFSCTMERKSTCPRALSKLSAPWCW